MNYFLEIESLGMPRFVGPFDSKASANAWAHQRISTGSWSVAWMETP